MAKKIVIGSSKKILILVDPSGKFKIINSRTLEIIREFYLGMGYIKMKIVGH